MEEKFFEINNFHFSNFLSLQLPTRNTQHSNADLARSAACLPSFLPSYDGMCISFFCPFVNQLFSFLSFRIQQQLYSPHTTDHSSERVKVLLFLWISILRFHQEFLNLKSYFRANWRWCGVDSHSFMLLKMERLTSWQRATSWKYFL